ncbi:MAG: hypothetical protein Q8S04_10910 [Bacteroidales bacterium]|nr:hypothetical protein [Bacteroidales bacterium]
MKNRLTYISGVIAICLLPVLTYSQQISEKRHYTFEKIEMKSPWLLSGNGAGIVFNTAENFANVGAYFTNESGSYKNFNQPEKYSTFGIETKSYTKIKNVFFYGSFRYDYGINKDLAWRGTIYPGSNINTIVDSIPGKVLREDYIMSGKVGYNLSKKLSIGVAFDYQTSTAAKRIDGRNLNTLSKLVVSPGMTFSSKPVVAGLNLTYKRDVERVDYDFIGDVTGKKIYYMEGLWFYTLTGITNTTILERQYLRDLFGASLQAQVKIGDLSFFNQFSVDFGNEDDYDGSNFSKRYATVENLKYVYDGVIRYSAENTDHFITLSFINEENISYNVINDYELIPGEANNWAFFEYGKTLRYMTNYRKMGAEYKTYFREGEWRCSWILAAGFNQHYVEKRYKAFPAYYYQDFTVNEAYVRINRDLNINEKATLSLDINGAYIFGDGTKLRSYNPLTVGALKLNNSILDADYNYNTAQRMSIGGGVKYQRVLDSQKGNSVYCGLAYKHLTADDKNRALFSMSIGLNF